MEIFFSYFRVIKKTPQKKEAKVITKTLGKKIKNCIQSNLQINTNKINKIFYLYHINRKPERIFSPYQIKNITNNSLRI